MDQTFLSYYETELTHLRQLAEEFASPILRSDPGFVGQGFTAGGAREFVLPNGPIPADAATRVVR